MKICLIIKKSQCLVYHRSKLLLLFFSFSWQIVRCILVYIYMLISCIHLPKTQLCEKSKHQCVKSVVIMFLEFIDLYRLYVESLNNKTHYRGFIFPKPSYCLYTKNYLRRSAFKTTAQKLCWPMHFLRKYSPLRLEDDEPQIPVLARVFAECAKKLKKRERWAAMQIKCRFFLYMIFFFFFEYSMCVIREKKEKGEKWTEINREKLAEVIVWVGWERRCTVSAQSLSWNPEQRRIKPWRLSFSLFLLSLLHI